MVLWTFALPASALTCDEIFTLTSSGRPEPEIVQGIRLGGDLALDDLTCLSAGGASRVVLDAARWKLAHPSSPPAPAPAPSPVPAAGPRLDIEFVGAVLAGARADGTAWDPGANTVGTAVSLGMAAAGGPGLARLGQAGTVGLAAPDVRGWVRLVPAAGEPERTANRRLALDGGADTSNPSFEDPARYRGWPLDPGLVFEVHLWDRDPGGVDDLAPVRIGADALAPALAARGTYAVPVGEQSSGLLTHVLVRVAPSSLPDRHVDGTAAP